ncbi:hypothetical protein [Acinetobacter colistiniresistens]|uniref:hypothetical protein n=1 Tax=Acinetobacter colistiniresistens TaxID=280145 RepID=UPI00124FC8AD|nr:hypothetical protein [Acinetobacter colistiniresistens]
MFFYIISWMYKIFFIVGFFLIISKKNKLVYCSFIFWFASLFTYLYDLKKNSENSTYIRRDVCGKYIISSPKTSMRGAGKVLDVTLNVESYGEFHFEAGADDFNRDTEGMNLKDREICVNVNIRILDGKEDLENVTGARKIIVK